MIRKKKYTKNIAFILLPLLQEHLLQSYFSIFYFAINLGSLLSMIVTPMLRGKWFNVNMYLVTHSCAILKKINIHCLKID